MTEKKRDQDDSPDTLSRLEVFPPGSLESRVAARAFIADTSKPPSFIVRFVRPGPRDGDGSFIGEREIECDSHRATIANYGTSAAIEGRDLARAENESLSDFERRISGEMPAVGPGLAIMWPAEPYKFESYQETGPA